MPIFSTEQYAWKDIQVTMLNKPITGIQEVKYTVSQEKEHIFGAGANPVSIARGNKTYEGTIRLLQSELEAIQATLAPEEDLPDLRNVNIVVNYKGENGALVTDILQGVEFTELEKGMEQNDKNMSVDIPFLFLGKTRG